MLRSAFRARAHRPLAFAAALTTFAAAGCGDSTTSPSSIAGSYRATTLTISQSGQGSLDALAAGVKLSLTIASSNATTGTLYTPASLNGGVAETLPITATAVRTGNTVRFNTSDDAPLVGDLTFTADGSTLRADQNVDATRVVVVLTRQ